MQQTYISMILINLCTFRVYMCIIKISSTVDLSNMEKIAIFVWLHSLPIFDEIHVISI